MCPIIFDLYGIRTGEVFTFQGKTEQFLATDILTHNWNPVTEVLEILSEPEVVVRSVRNINSPSPVPKETIKVGYSYFRNNCVYVSLQNHK